MSTPRQSPARSAADPPDAAGLLTPHLDAVLGVRRDLHAHPETGRNEHRTSQVVADRLAAAGLHPRPMPGTGLLCDIGPDGDDAAPLLALRADLDALPVQEETDLPFASTVDGVAHACGHDVHTAVVLGAGLALADAHRAGRLRSRVRLIFQPAEELQPGGALDAVAAGALEGVGSILAVHCDPHTDVGHVGLRVGPITSASDHVLVRLRGDGGHTSRPQLTQDLVYALAQVVTGVPAVLSRRLDPRAGTALVWGRISAGGAPNAIPRLGVVEGTLRCLDADAWAATGAMLPRLVEEVVAPFGVRAEVEHVRGVPPVVNDASAVALLERAAGEELGLAAVVPTEQSLGGEDFAWYLEHVPGALARLGTRTPGGPTHDLHRGDLEIDERALGIGVRLLVAAALRHARHAAAERAGASGQAVGGAAAVADR